MCFYSLVAGIGQVRTYTAGVSQSMEDGGCACRTRHRYVKQNYHLYVSMTRLNRYNEIARAFLSETIHLLQKRTVVMALATT